MSEIQDLHAPRWVECDEIPAAAGSEILPGLFMGGTEDNDTIDQPAARLDLRWAQPYDAVVTLYGYAQPMQWGVEEFRYGFGDGDMSHVDFDRLMRVVRFAHERWVSGERVLVRCQAGLNRSGLVTALVLMLDGHQASDAIRLIRERRSEFALCNNDFTRWLVDEAEAAVVPHRRASSAA